MVFRYAEEIFSLGQELMGTLKGRPQVGLARVNVGVTEVMPKLVAYQLIELALKLKDPYRIICREGTNSELLAALAVHDIDDVKRRARRSGRQREGFQPSTRRVRRYTVWRSPAGS